MPGMAAVISLQDTFPCSLGFPGKLPRQRCPGPAAPGTFLNSAALVRFQEKKNNNNKKNVIFGSAAAGTHPRLPGVVPHIRSRCPEH